MYKGKWDIPDDPQTQKDLALVIEHLYEHAKNDEGREFPYIIELKTPRFKFVQDLDIRTVDNFDCTVFLSEQEKVLRTFFPGRDLTCVVYDSSGFSRKINGYKTSYHIAWNVIVDQERAMNIHQATLDAFEEASSQPGTTLAHLQETLLAVQAGNTWSSVIDDTVHKNNGIRMPYCDKCEVKGQREVTAERRPAVAVGEFRFEGGCARRVDADLPIHEWVLKGMLRTSEGLTEPFALTRRVAPPPPTNPTRMSPGSVYIDYGSVSEPWLAVVRENYTSCLEVIEKCYPGIEIRRVSCAPSLRGIVVYFNPEKSEVSKKCPFRETPHASNNIFFAWTVLAVDGAASHLAVRCYDRSCAKQEKRLPSPGPVGVDVPDADIPVRKTTVPLQEFRQFALDGERGLAELVARALAGEVVYAGKKWFFYEPSDGIWAIRPEEKMLGLEYEVLREAIDGAAEHLGECTDLAPLRASVSKVAKRKSIREDLRDLLYVHDFEARLDQSTSTLSCRNGMVDLRTGQLRPRTKDDYCTFYCDCVYGGDAPTPVPDAFIRELMLDDEEMCTYLQTVLGYAMCGVNPKQGQRFFIFYGPTENGKSKLLKILSNLLGRYCKAMESGTLQMQTKHANAATPATRMLCPPVRIAFQDEQASNLTLNNSLIKEMTGGNVITARYLHENPIQYTPTFCPFLITDAQPTCSAEQSLKRRVRYVRFEARFKSEEAFDPTNPTHKRKVEDIEERFAEEEAKTQLLAWLVKGAVRYHSYGSFSKVPQPAAVEEATADFIAENDVVADFLALCDLTNPNAFADTTDIHSAFQSLMQQNIPRAELKDLLRAKGYVFMQVHTKENRGKRGFRGITLPKPGGAEEWVSVS